MPTLKNDLVNAFALKEDFPFYFSHTCCKLWTLTHPAYEQFYHFFS